MKAEAVFLTNSLMGVMPVKSIDDKKFKLDNEIYRRVGSGYMQFLKA